MILLRVSALAFLIGMTQSKTFEDIDCKNLKVFDGFELEKLNGSWYEVDLMTQNELKEERSCGKITFEDSENGILRVNSISRIGDDTFELNGKTSFFSQHGLLRTTAVDNFGINYEMTHYVRYLNPTHGAIIYSCGSETSDENKIVKSVKILSHEKNISEKLAGQVLKMMKKDSLIVHDNLDLQLYNETCNFDVLMPREREIQPLKECPDLSGLDFPDIMEKISGNWYLGHVFPKKDENQECIKTNFGPTGMGQFLKKTVGIYSGALKDIEFRTNVQRNGIYTSFETNQNEKNGERRQILDFNHNQFFSLYSCKKHQNGVTQEGYVFFRQQNPSPHEVHLAFIPFLRLGMNPGLFTHIVQDGSCIKKLKRRLGFSNEIPEFELLLNDNLFLPTLERLASTPIPSVETSRWITLPQDTNFREEHTTDAETTTLSEDTTTEENFDSTTTTEDQPSDGSSTRALCISWLLTPFVLSLKFM